MDLGAFSISLAVKDLLASRQFYDKLGAWCVLCAVAYIANPAFAEVVNLWLFDMPMALFYITLSGCLLFRGLTSGRP